MNLNQVTIPVMSVERAISFYTGLGLQLIVKSLPDYARFQCPDGNSTFSSHRVNNLPDGDGVWIYFEVQDLVNHVKDLLEKCFRFEELPEDKPWLWRESRLKDPDNNQIIIYFAGENRINPPWRMR
jgi:catechol 2,3-dioxygenase-like lactoylglutathione lyase family enzyme